MLLDHAEDNLFEITRELVEDRHALNTVAVLADCKEEERMREVFREHRPTVVFHAAAYKHVGLMEDNPVEAVRNNAIATRVMARVAGDTGTKVFVQVSTDKAVDPATVMGASKALAEWAAEAANARYEDTAYTSVRFGNVLGSSGSVVPIFRRQIEAGGPVTVTDPDMTRFFMTIPEAVQLVIRAGSLAQGGEVFVLEMGEPVRIMDLAEDMIRFSGLEPGRDIAIEIVGRRPGEKLHEDLFNAYEHPEPTPAQKILRARRPAVDPAWVEATFDRIGLLVLEGDAAGLAATVSELATGRVAAPEPEPAPIEAAAIAARRGRRAARQPHGLLDSLAPLHGPSPSVLAAGPGREVRRLHRHRGVLRPGRALDPLLRAGARAAPPARLGRPRARARAGGRGPRGGAGRGRAPRPGAAARPRRPPATAAGAAATAAAAAAAPAAGEQATEVVEPAEGAAQAGNGTAAAASEAGEGDSRRAPPARTARSPAAARRPPARSRRGAAAAAARTDGDAEAAAGGEAKPEAEPAADGEPDDAEAEADAGAPTTPARGRSDAADARRRGREARRRRGAARRRREAPRGGRREARATAPRRPQAADGSRRRSARAAGRREGARRRSRRRRRGLREIPVAPVPRATPLPRRSPAPAAPLRQPSRSATVPPRRPAPAGARRSPVTPASAIPRRARGSCPRWSAPASLVLVVVALFATGVLGGGGDDTVAPRRTPTSSATPEGTVVAVRRSRPASTKVAVLNGTTIPGLASQREGQAHHGGLQRDRDGQQHGPAARRLLGALRHPRRRPRAGPHGRAGGSTSRRCSGMDADTRDLSEDADVVVILGQDKAP